MRILIKKFKLFLWPVSGLTKWLNEMSAQGYRLINIDNIFYYFQECEKEKYIYAVDFVSNKSYHDFRDYEEFLKESNIKHIEKPASIGKMAKGNSRWRPYADKGAKIAVSKGMIKKEFLILEKANDGKPFEIYTNIEDKINALKIMRKPTIMMMVFIGLMMLIYNINIIPQYQWSLFKLYLLPETNKSISMILLGIIEILCFANLVRFNLEISRYKKEGEINE